MGNLAGVLATAALCAAFYWTLYACFCRPRHSFLKFSELPAVLLICLCGRRYRRHLAGVLARRRAAWLRAAAPLPRPEKPRLRTATAGPPRRLPEPAREQLLRAEDALLAELAEFMCLNSATMADAAGAVALLARGFVAAGEARDRVAAVLGPPGSGLLTRLDRAEAEYRRGLAETAGPARSLPAATARFVSLSGSGSLTHDGTEMSEERAHVMTFEEALTMNAARPSREGK